ncbi:microfibril-associated glycoprotein 4-like [Colossoma macropomum]|uniref:microfibril-associated glycoprotein 4-like n=1 Tax=Colossoma macropomum TaxID=42526 RepID=UPI00186460C2|nr:microfibril-associated glycoprotein 4-like [Colossoma macropomum]XP_036413284.1 microfibril-associated glycoprotein 4-like [Colossoma macropomum]
MRKNFCSVKRFPVTALEEDCITMLLLALVLPLVVQSAPAYLPQDCEDVYINISQNTGVYTIYPGGPDKPVQVYCDMGCDEDRGRWTVIQRRMDGSVNFYRPWDEYKNGFGNASGEYWLGLQNIFLITSRGKYELRIYMEDFDKGSVYAHYTSFSIDSETYRYKLHASGFINGGAGESLFYHNDMQFATYDRDTNGCAVSNSGGYWFNNCLVSNLNGLYKWGPSAPQNAAIVWCNWKGCNYSLKTVVMKIKRAA